MGKQVGPDYITGTVGDRTYYQLNGQYLVRAKSTLSRRRVKRSPAFRRTMEYAGWLAAASKIAGEVYRMIPRERRKVKIYREMTGRAMDLIKQGTDAATVKAQLIQQYLPKAMNMRLEAPVQRPVIVRPRKVIPLFSTGQRVKRIRRGIRLASGGKAACSSGAIIYRSLQTDDTSGSSG
jgi:gamma-glutamylcyclotransferase (GGCT)/AIG2-like uncharacterized protein YtfP